LVWSLLLVMPLMFLLVYGCSTGDTTTTTSPSPTTTSELLNELAFEDFPLGSDMLFKDIPTHIHIMTDIDSPIPNFNGYFSPAAKTMLDAVDYSRYFILFTFMGSQPFAGPKIEVERIWQVENVIYVEANFDKGGPTYQPTITLPFDTVKVSKDNMTQYGEITFILLDQDGEERARTVCEIPG